MARTSPECVTCGKPIGGESTGMVLETEDGSMVLLCPECSDEVHDLLRDTYGVRIDPETMEVVKTVEIGPDSHTPDHPG